MTKSAISLRSSTKDLHSVFVRSTSIDTEADAGLFLKSDPIGIELY